MTTYKREQRVCVNCGAQFLSKPFSVSQHCSRACSHETGKRKRTKPRPVCAECGQPCKYLNHKYCSKQCANDAIGRVKVARRPVVTCEWCGKETQPRQRNADSQLYCGPACWAMARWADHVKMTPADARARRRNAVVCRYQRQAIFERDNWTCGLCGERVDRRCKHPHPRSPTIDHIVPIARGGVDAPWNVQAAHFGCNCRKNAGSMGSQLHLPMEVSASETRG